MPHVSFWRPSRAWHSWVAGHRLAFFGIPTPAPLAMLEERVGPLRRRAFLVTDYCPGESLMQRLSPDHEPDAEMAAALISLFEQFFPTPAAAETVPGGKSIACSSPAAIAWDASFASMADPSGRAVAGVHDQAVASI